MIREEGNAFHPGTPRPTPYYNLTEDFSAYPEIEDYLQTKGWTEGRSVLLIGPKQCGKTSLGISIMRAAGQVETHRQHYWTEHDYLADLRQQWRFEDMTGKLPKDDSLWMEYLEWERLFWDLKEGFHLFLDDMCQGYTPMQWYESECFLRERAVRNLPTMLAVGSAQWDATADSMQGIMCRTNVIIEMGADDGRRE